MAEKLLDEITRRLDKLEVAWSTERERQDQAWEAAREKEDRAFQELIEAVSQLADESEAVDDDAVNHDGRLGHIEATDASDVQKTPTNSVARQVFDKMIDPPQHRKQADFMALEVCNLSKAEKDFTPSMDELFEQDDMGFDPGGNPKVVLAKKSELIDNDDVLIAKRLIVDDDGVNGDAELVNDKSVAQQVPGEMSEPQNCLELELSIEVEKDTKAIKQCKFNPSVPSSSVLKGQVDSKIFKLKIFGEGKKSLQQSILICNDIRSERGFSPKFEIGRGNASTASKFIYGSLSSFYQGVVQIEFLKLADVKRELLRYPDRIFQEDRNDISGVETSLLRPKLGDVGDFAHDTGRGLYSSENGVRTLHLISDKENFASFLVLVYFSTDIETHLFGSIICLVKFCFDPGGGLPITKFTNTGKWFLKLSCVETGVIVFLGVFIPTIDLYFGWNTEVRTEKGEFMLVNEGVNILEPPHYTSMQKREAFKVRANIECVGLDKLIRRLHSAFTTAAFTHYVAEFVMTILVSLWGVSAVCCIHVFDPGIMNKNVMIALSASENGLARCCSHGNHTFGSVEIYIGLFIQLKLSSYLLRKGSLHMSGINESVVPFLAFPDVYTQRAAFLGLFIYKNRMILTAAEIIQFDLVMSSIRYLSDRLNLPFGKLHSDFTTAAFVRSTTAFEGVSFDLGGINLELICVAVLDILSTKKGSFSVLIFDPGISLQEVWEIKTEIVPIFCGRITSKNGAEFDDVEGLLLLACEEPEV